MDGRASTNAPSDKFLANTPSYPTRSLEFLQKLTQKTSRASNDISKHSKVQLTVVVVGAGLGGLATAVALARRGHRVTVLEQTPELSEVGAGIQIPPNYSRLLLRWGLEPLLRENITEPEGMILRRWEDGKVIGYTKLTPNFRENFGAPYYVVHRAHFHHALHKLARELGAEVVVNSKVVGYDAEEQAVQLEDGSRYTADLIVGADGWKSTLRATVLGGIDRPPQPTGFACYRATVDVKLMLKDPDVAWLLDKPAQNLWMGPGRHIMSYSIAGGKSFNMVLSYYDRTDPSSWTQDTALEDMRQQYAGWDPKLLKLISMIKTTLKWPLVCGQSLDRWVAPSGHLLLIGDAAHAMVPYMAVGAAMAVEDAGALAEVLNHMSFRHELSDALRIFEKERIKRCTQMQEASLVKGTLLQLADGPEQQLRDEAMRLEVEGKQFIASPNMYSDPVTQWWCYGYDAEEAMAEAWKGAKSVADKELVDRVAMAHF